MARIRNIKPDLFRHEALQDLEAAHPGAHIILTYIALWTQADKNGVFPWKPRLLALDILPFLQINIEQNLQILLQAGYLQTFENQQNTYGYIPTFQRHQIIPTKEKTAPSKYPTPPGTHPEQSRHTPGISEEGKRNKENGKRSEGNAHAHEEEKFEKQKNETPTPPPQPSNGGGGSTPPDHYFENILKEINTWARPNDWQPLRDYAASVGYDPAQYGPVSDEVKKFVTYYLDPRRHPDDRAALHADPAQFFQDKGRKWLLDAKTMNRQKPKNKEQKPKYEPPTHFTRRSPSEGGQRTNNSNATTVAHIGDITHKIITEI